MKQIYLNQARELPYRFSLHSPSQALFVLKVIVYNLRLSGVISRNIIVLYMLPK